MAFFGGLRTMWLIVLFDLPTETPQEKKNYRDFRGFLLNDGFTPLQYSVYARHCASDENAFVHLRRIQASLPTGGEVRVLQLTDKQFGRMAVFHGRLPKQIETPPEQILLL